MANLATAIVAAVILGAGASPSGYAKGCDDVACGDAISGLCTMTADLECPAGHGLRVLSGTTLDCNGHTIRGADQERYGIYLDGEDLAGADDVVVQNCIVEQFEVGIRLRNVARAIIRNNVTRRNTSGAAYGIELTQGTTDALILGNSVTDNGDEGIHVSGESQPTGHQITDNIVIHNTFEGIYLLRAHGNVVTRNDVHDNGAAGIYVNGSNDNVIEGNDLTNDPIQLVSNIDPEDQDVIHRSDDNTVRRNTIRRTPAGGLGVGLLVTGYANTIAENVITGADGGIEVRADDVSGAPGRDNLFTCNLITNNGVGLVFGAGATPNAVHENMIMENVVGLDASSVDPADPAIEATANWWGCSTGPNTADCDTTMGHVDVSRPAATEPSDWDGDGAGDACDTCTDVDGDEFGDSRITFPASMCPEDNCPDLPNSSQADTDADGVGDACDPCTDTDGDDFGDPGFSASVCPVDNCPGVPNADQADADNDGVGDACDLCPGVPNADQADADEDTVGDVCDLCPGVPDADQANADNDAMGDACDPCTDTDGDDFGDPGFSASACPVDNCPGVPNADQADTDNDGVGDVCDLCPGVPNADQADADDDAVGDACDPCTDSDGDRFADAAFPTSPDCPADNCTDVSNADQADADADGIGDACDPCTDEDGDGFGFPTAPTSTCPVDNCPAIPNADQADADSNGTGDVCECRGKKPGRCLPGGGNRRTDCLVEFSPQGPVSLNRKGTRPKNTLPCRDGNPACDGDRSPDGSCTFAIAICLGNEDPRLPQCEATPLESLEVRLPRPDGDGPAVDRANAARIEKSATALGLAIRRRSGIVIRSSDAVPGHMNTCGPFIDLVVPAPSRAGKKAARRTFKIVGRTAGGRRDRNKLVLICRAAR